MPGFIFLDILDTATMTSSVKRMPGGLQHMHLCRVGQVIGVPQLLYVRQPGLDSLLNLVCLGGIIFVWGEGVEVFMATALEQIGSW